MNKARLELMIRYLLNDVSEQERNELEEQYASNPDLLAELTEVENDLMDDYASGGLSAADRALFESRYLKNAERNQRREFATALATYLQEARAGSPGISHKPNRAAGWWRSKVHVPKLMATPQFLSGILALVVAVAVSYIFQVQRQMQKEIAQIQSEQGKLYAGEQQLSSQIDKLQTDRSQVDATNEAPGQNQRTVARLILVPNLSRGSGKEPSIALDASVSSLELRLPLVEDHYQSYSVSIKTADGAAVWQRENVRSRAGPGGRRFIRLQVPVKALTNSDYVVRLFGTGADDRFEDVAAFLFRVRRY